jgi:ParB family transcriptional regulator, chromosome partitioning protein
MKNDSSRIIKQNLSTLLKKFSKNDVIVQMEKEYNTSSAKVLPTLLIDDNSVLKDVKINENDVKNLTESIHANGILTPLVVRPKNGHFEIVLGRKRLFAAKALNLKEVPAIIRDINDEEMLIMLLAFMRDNHEINAVGIAILCDRLTKEYRYTQQALADLTHQSRSQITNTLRLLNLPKLVLDEISSSRLSYGHAKALATLPESVINDFVEKIHSQNLSVRTIEKMVADYKHVSINLSKEKMIQNKFKADVKTSHKSVTLKFATEEELQAFIDNLAKTNG